MSDKIRKVELASGQEILINLDWRSIIALSKGETKSKIKLQSKQFGSPYGIVISGSATTAVAVVPESYKGCVSGTALLSKVLKSALFYTQIGEDQYWLVTFDENGIPLPGYDIVLDEESLISSFSEFDEDVKIYCQAADMEEADASAIELNLDDLLSDPQSVASTEVTIIIKEVNPIFKALLGTSVAAIGGLAYYFNLPSDTYESAAERVSAISNQVSVLKAPAITSKPPSIEVEGFDLLKADLALSGFVADKTIDPVYQLLLSSNPEYQGILDGTLPQEYVNNIAMNMVRIKHYQNFIDFNVLIKAVHKINELLLGSPFGWKMTTVSYTPNLLMPAKMIITLDKDLKQYGSVSALESYLKENLSLTELQITVSANLQNPQLAQLIVHFPVNPLKTEKIKKYISFNYNDNSLVESLKKKEEDFKASLTELNDLAAGFTTKYADSLTSKRVAPFAGGNSELDEYVEEAESKLNDLNSLKEEIKVEDASLLSKRFKSHSYDEDFYPPNVSKEFMDMVYNAPLYEWQFSDIVMYPKIRANQEMMVEGPVVEVSPEADLDNDSLMMENEDDMDPMAGEMAAAKEDVVKPDPVSPFLQGHNFTINSTSESSEMSYLLEILEKVMSQKHVLFESLEINNTGSSMLWSIKGQFITKFKKQGENDEK